MNCCITELRNKEVINKENGCRLGNVYDVEVNTCDGTVVALIIFGRPRCFGLFGRDEDIKIPWNDICVIGPDTILVSFKPCDTIPRRRRHQNFFDGFFR